MGWQQRAASTVIDPRVNDLASNLYLLFQRNVFTSANNPPFCLTTIDAEKHKIILNFTPPTSHEQIDALLMRMNARYRSYCGAEIDAYLIDSVENYAKKYARPGAQRDPAMHDLLDRLDAANVFNRTTYPEVQLHESGITRGSLDYMCDSALAKVHRVTDTDKCRRKRSMRDELLFSAQQYFQRHYGVRLPMYRIEARQESDGWSITAVNISSGEHVAQRKL